MDFGLLILIAPLAIGALIWAKDETDSSVPKGEPKSGTFFMFLIVIIVIGLVGFLSLGFGSGR